MEEHLVLDEGYVSKASTLNFETASEVDPFDTTIGEVDVEDDEEDDPQEVIHLTSDEGGQP